MDPEKKKRMLRIISQVVMAAQQLEIDLDDGVMASFPKFANSSPKIPSLVDKVE